MRSNCWCFRPLQQTTIDFSPFFLFVSFFIRRFFWPLFVQQLDRSFRVLLRGKMPREKDPFRDYVEFLQNNKWKCNFCNIKYRGSVTRIKAHLAGFGGYGINDCKKVDPQVRSEARKVLKSKGAAESSNGSEGNVQGSSYPHLISSGLTQDPHQPVTVSNEDAWRETSFATMPSTRFDTMSTVGARSSAFRPLHETNVPNQSIPAQNMISQQDFSFWTQPPQSQAGDYYIQRQSLSHPSGGGDLAPEALTNVRGPVNAEEGAPNAEVPQDERTGYALMDSRPSTCGLVDKNMPTPKRMLEELSNREACLPLVTTELVGEESEGAIKKICDYLMEDKIDIVGIYGMGGVGKTAISMHVHNRILENPAFNDAFWVTVPPEFSVYELQEEIANVVGLDNLSKDKDVKRRACILHRHLKKKNRSVLLLDELWMHFEVEDVGIPVGKGGLKLVLTTRSLDVCHKMLCQKHIEIEPLWREEDEWSLFLKKLCSGKELPSEVKKMATSILLKCGGLPLGIIEIATRMRGVEEMYEWREILRKLENSMLELDVFNKLKLSYMKLGNPQVQQCFLHLILCCGGCHSETSAEDLIESFIDEGLLSGKATRQELQDEGNTILGQIKKACLGVDLNLMNLYVHVHPLISDMVLQIVTSTTHMVKARMGLKEIPEEEFWTVRLEKVFLECNDIREIPYDISPNCPKLTRLSLNDNFCLVAIHESFFKHLKSLKVLDLSCTGITELPDSISHLESLEALLLRRCMELHRIPFVGKLCSLRKLDLNWCRRLKEVPEGMEMLVKLTFLDLFYTGIETLPEGVLGKLLNLQYLAIKKLRAGEEIKLRKVEELYCSVPNVETFNACTRFLEQNSSRRYALFFGLSEDDTDCYWDVTHESRIVIESCHSIETRKDGESGGDGGALLLPKNVQELEVKGCGGVTRLCEVGPLHNLEELRIKEWENLEEVGSVDFPRLRSLSITGCPKLKHLWEDGQGPVGAPNLEEIIIDSCEKLEEIICIGGGPVPSGVVTCGCLERLKVNRCNNMKRVLVTQDMSLHLPSLRKISVKSCEGIEVIIGDVANPTHASFPEITHLNLWNLPELKSICDGDGTVSWDSLQYIDIGECPKLKRIPVQLPLLDNGLLPSLRKIRIDRATWESLEWDHPWASSSLGPLVHFYSVRDGESFQG